MADSVATSGRVCSSVRARRLTWRTRAVMEALACEGIVVEERRAAVQWCRSAV